MSAPLGFFGVSSLPARAVSIRRPPMMTTERATTARASLYQVLRVTETATAREIKQAYRYLAKRFHPDVAPTGGEAADSFLEIRRAYETLTDPAARAQYDYDRSIAGKRNPVVCLGPNRLRFSRWETDQCW
ncbi:hypothetical protein Cni_G15141 [Canna indica]|uniref:J domain-containing protein n=1 Tax=Canna indica TaxID=4628 RepID=A0AAQ3KHG1_9LILI|nr:hypothetical protein Cni_G15141 [Canna indica]